MSDEEILYDEPIDEIDDALDEVEGSDLSNEPNKNSLDYKMMIDLIRTLEDNIKTLEKSVRSQLIEKYNLKEEILDALLPIKKGKIRDTDANEFRDILLKYYKYNSDELRDKHKKKLEDTPDEDIYNTIENLKEASIMIMSAKKECAKIKEESVDILDDYMNFMSSSKVKEAKLNNLDRLKEAIKNEPNELAKKKMEKKITIMENSLSYQFLLTPFNKNRTREVNSIKEGFFNDKKGSYIIKRYQDKIKQFGFNSGIYHYLLNIEENFCKEEYYPFNNLFLFIYMRMVAYADFYNEEDKMYVHSLTGALANLVYHKFDNANEERTFIDVIEAVLNNFKDDVDKFKEENTTWEGHPVRQEQENRHNRVRKEKLLEKMKELKYPNDIPEDIDVEELQKLFDMYVDGLIDEQAEPEEIKETNFEAVRDSVIRTEGRVDRIEEMVSEVSE